MAYTTIDDPSAHFQAQAYTGNGADNHAITNDGNSDLQPDYCWVKDTSDTSIWYNIDSSRGVSANLHSNNNANEDSASYITSFDSDGFTVDNNGAINEDGVGNVGFQWKANGGTRSTFTESGNNMGGGYQVNAAAGFSIIDYVGTGSAGYFSHGLGAAPECIIIKNRSYAGNWRFWHHKMSGVTYRASLNTDAAESSGWDSWTVGSSTVTLGVDGSVNRDGDNHIAYCFRSIKGYSKFGIYTGNGNANGVFVYTGFQPRWLVVKPRTLVSNYFQLDTARDTYNPATKFLRLDTTHAEDDGADKDIDFLSNGFKTRAATGFHNDNNQTHLYMAFAKHPFVTSGGVPCTAR